MHMNLWIHLKEILFNDEVYVFTPQGDVIDLPKSSTPVDFAYKVHSEVGNRCVGAKVNGKIQPLFYKLKTGDIVNILTSKNSTCLNIDWLEFVVSTHTKNKIKSYFKKKSKDKNLDEGKDLLEKEVRRKGYNLSKILQKEWLQQSAEKFNKNSIENLYSAIGEQSLNIENVIKFLEEKYDEKFKKEKELSNLANIEIDNKVNKNYNVSEGITIDDISNLDVKYAKCCNPVPGDKVIGYITNGHGVSIHRKDCNNINNLRNKERLIDVKWNRNSDSSFNVVIIIIIIDKPGYLADLLKKYLMRI